MTIRKVNIDVCWVEGRLNDDMTTDITVVPVWKPTRKQDVEYNLKNLKPAQLTQLAETCMRQLKAIEDRAKYYKKRAVEAAE